MGGTLEALQNGKQQRGTDAELERALMQKGRAYGNLVQEAKGTAGRQQLDAALMHKGRAYGNLLQDSKGSDGKRQLDTALVNKGRPYRLLLQETRGSDTAADLATAVVETLEEAIHDDPSSIAAAVDAGVETLGLV